MARLSAGTLAVAIIAVLLALTGAFTVRQFLEAREQSSGAAAAQPQAKKIPIAMIELEQGRVLRESDFAYVTMSQEKFGESRYAKIVFINQIEQLIGRVVRAPVAKGGTVGPDQLYPEGTGPMVAEKLPQGMRAVTVKVSGSGFADGLASPGTFVDILFRSLGGGEGDDVTPETTIVALAGVEVLSVDANEFPKTRQEGLSQSGGVATGDARVTFAVEPSQATLLKALEDRGEISLALRPLSDGSEVAAQAVVEGGIESNERHAQTVRKILEGVKSAPVVVATTELGPGRVVRQGDLRLMENATDGDDVEGRVTYGTIESLVGRTLRADVTPGQVITADILYPEGVSPGVADRLPPGYRAVTVNMDNDSLVNGFVSPGTEVDVFFRSESLEGYPETTLRVLDGLKVLAIEDQVSAGADGDRESVNQAGVRVTLAVAVGEVGKIQALEGHGTMSLVVRAVGERPIGEIAREMDSIRQQLEVTQKHISALKRISQLDDSIKLSKEQTAKLAELMDEVPILERKLASLDEEKVAASTGVSQTTLAEVLNLPEPARPTRLDIYKGGSRETLVFNPGIRAASLNRTASRADEKAGSGSPKKKAVKPLGPVKQASDTQEVDTENVSVIVPDRKVSATSMNGSGDIDRLVASSRGVRRQSSPVQFGNTAKKTMAAVKSASESNVRRTEDDTLMSAITNFGRGLVNGLNRATLPAQRVEIVRGGVKD